MRRTVFLPASSTGLCLMVITGLAWLVTSAAANPQGDSPIITPQQIEADFLRQDALRENPAASIAAKLDPNATPELDAAGGVDGIKNGQWGFHTADEPNPWWQVDLGKSIPLDRIVLYNRCDNCSARNSRIMILLSDDGKSFKQVYQHSGKNFFGHSDKKPLVAPMDLATGRYLRLQLPGKSYFHLDEVEVYPVGSQENIALGKPATQSSISQWSVAHKKVPAAQVKLAKAAETKVLYGTAKAIERGLRLAEDLRARGAQVDAEARTLEDLASRLEQLPTDASAEACQKIHMDARWAVRRMALKNPLLDFDSILFVKRAPGRFPHMSDQFYGWWSRPGGGLYVLEGFKSDKPKLRCLTQSWPEGNFLRPELSYDGTKVLFAFCKYYDHVPNLPDKVKKSNLPEDAYYHVFEMNLDGSGLRQLTRGRYDDFDARYLPNNDIVFLSTRKGVFLQCTKANSMATCESDLPDSYVRCGGGNSRPVPVFTLHVIDKDGGNLHPISAFENFEWTPGVNNDGRILYTRWDYIDRFNGHFFSLWSTNPDGTNPQLVYGNYTVRPQVVFEARPIPNSQKLICTAGAHHSNVGGSLILLDRTRGTEESAPIVRLTPEVAFPETEGWANMYYANPSPLSEEHYLVAWSDRRLPGHSRLDDQERNPINATGLYLYDAFGNLNLIYRDPQISCESPTPLRPRPRPPIYADSVAWDGPQEGRFLLQDVYDGLGDVPRGTIKRLRVVGVPPKVQPHMNNPNLGVSAEDPGKFILGTVPVEADGSAYFRVPSGVSVLFQALDADGLAVQTMRSLTYVQPNQTLACVGCHESREAAPRPAKYPLAMMREPSRLALGPAGSWPLKYDQLVQPVLEKHCVSCHQPSGKDAKAAKFDLTVAKSYENLLGFGNKDLRNLAFEKDRSLVGHTPTRKSRLWAMLTSEKGHEGVRLDPDSLDRLATWMDTYAHRQGHFSPQQEEELRQFQQRLANMLAE